MTELISFEEVEAELEKMASKLVAVSVASSLLQKMYETFEQAKGELTQFLQEQGSKLTDTIAERDAQSSTIANLEHRLALATADVQVKVNPTRYVISRTTPAVSFIENPPLWSKTTWPTAKASIAQCCGAYKVHLFPFGLTDPWPDPSKPNLLTPDPENPAAIFQGQRLGNALKKIREIDNTAPIILTLYAAPWWMKGKLSQTGGMTTLMTASEAYSDSGRVLSDKLPQWLTLVDSAVTLAAGLGVLDFEIWNEAKGYYSTPLGIGQTWDARYASGSAGRADMGYSYFYDVTSQQVITTMTRLGIQREEYRIGGPYPVLSTRGDLTVDAIDPSHPLAQYANLWGYANKAPINFVREFLGYAKAHHFALDALSLDVSTFLQSGSYPTSDPFNLTRKIGDIVPYWRATLVEFGFDGDMPINFSELYPTPPPDLQTANSEALRAVLWADVLKACVLNRVAYPLAWGPTSPAGGSFGNLGGLIDANGSLQATGKVFAAFRKHFGIGSPIYLITASNGLVDGLASDTGVLLYNKTGSPLTVAFEDEVIDLIGYSYSVIER